MKRFKIILSISLFTLLFTAKAVNLPNFVPLIEKYSPAVVNISTTSNVKKQIPNFNFKEFNDRIPFEKLPDMFKHFFDHDFKDQNYHDAFQTSSLGSGMIISHDGFILTNHHVIKDAKEIIVRLKNRREYKAKLVGSDEHTDIALIKIDAKNLPTINIGDSRSIRVGEWVFAIGSPFGFDLSASAGIVSAKGRSVPGESQYNYVPFIQTDVAINPGNSGGPLFNLRGEVVGVNSMIFSRSGGYMGVSFSIPIEVAMNVVRQLRASGSVTRGWLGVIIQPVTYDLAQSFGMNKPEGSLVLEIVENSPASSSDLKVGDVILKFNGKKIINNSDLPPLVATTPIGHVSTLEVLRKGKKVLVEVKIDALPSNKLASAKTMENKTLNIGGLSLTDVPDTMRKKLNLSSGGAVVSSVEQDSAAEKSGIMVGDVILMFNYVEIKGASELQNLIKDLPKDKSVPVLLKRNSNSTFLAFKK